MPTHYTPLASSDDGERELNAAFDDDEDNQDDDENTPLNRATAVTSAPSSTPNTASHSGIYDFERDYDVPPPGSPPRPSAMALPNDFGNSNGLLPSGPIRPPHPVSRTNIRPSFFRRVVGAVLPTHYAQIPTEDASEARQRIIGGGTDNDGVFANVTAKPQPAQVIRTADGNVHLVPEDAQNEAPPSYQSAQADAVPPYWETTIVAPAGTGEPGSDMIVDELPTGSVWVFFVNVGISFFFNFIGFLLTFLLHTSHAGKYGSRAGLGLTLIKFGLYSRSNMQDDIPGGNIDENPIDVPDPLGNGGAPDPTPTDDINMQANFVSVQDWFSFLFMTVVCWFLFLTSCIGYWRVKRWESSIRSSSTGTNTTTTTAAPPSSQAPLSPEEFAREQQLRLNLQTVFGIAFEDVAASSSHTIHVDEHGHTIVVPNIPSQQALEEARLQRDLRAAGLF